MQADEGGGEGGEGVVEIGACQGEQSHGSN